MDRTIIYMLFYYLLIILQLLLWGSFFIYSLNPFLFGTIINYL